MDFESSMQTISWFKDRYREGSLVIKPPYQRKPVWAARQKCNLIESILLGLPVPEVYIQLETTADGETTHSVVDGQQRIRTILQFIGIEEDPDEKQFNKFVLDKLTPDADFYEVGFADLENEERKDFYEYKLVVRYLKTDSEAEVRDMFKRLNQYLTPLKAQELRNAIYTGPFVQLALRLADNEYWAENRIVTPAVIRRMGDVEFVSELVIGVIHGPQAGSARVVDEYYEQYEDYEDEFPGQKSAVRRFNTTLEFVDRLIPDIKDSRWGNKTDFYSLFIALAHLLKTHKIAKSKEGALSRKLESFADDVDRAIGSPRARVSSEVASYARAVERGANDKARRADRHLALTDEIEPLFTEK